MPAQHDRPTRRKLKGAPRQTPVLPEPGIGGYNYPRGPYGATGFPGSTPASKRTHSQGPDGRDDPQFRGSPTQTISTIEEQWATLPRRTRQTRSYRGGTPDFVRQDMTAQQPKAPWAPTPGIGPEETGRAAGWDVPVRLHAHSTGPEKREIPVIGALTDMGQRKNVRNELAQRYKADPLAVREYRVSPNPGKTGAHLDAPALNHPGTMVHGHPDGQPVPGMRSLPGMTPPTVTVQSRFFSAEGGQEDYAMNRPLLFARGGTPARIPPGAAPHIRGARMSGQRYFGAILEQQRIGLDSDSYGIVRRRGPRHRPVRFDLPAPHTTNYYDVPPESDTQAPDMIHRSPGRSRHSYKSPSPGTPRRRPTRRSGGGGYG